MRRRRHGLGAVKIKAGILFPWTYICPEKIGHGEGLSACFLNFLDHARSSRLPMNTFVIANPSDLHSELIAQVGPDASVDVPRAMQTLTTELRHRLGQGISVDLECLGQRAALVCRSAGFVDLMLALFVWAKQRYGSPQTACDELKLRVCRRGPEVEIAIWERSPGPPCIRCLTLWSQLGARIEQLGGRMQVEPEGFGSAGQTSPGQWRRLWIAARN